jgi:hypothetical protein
MLKLVMGLYTFVVVIVVGGLSWLHQLNSQGDCGGGSSAAARAAAAAAAAAAARDASAGFTNSTRKVSHWLLCA